MDGWRFGLALALAAFAAPAVAAVNGVGDSGFSVTESAHIAAPPSQVYAALIQPGRWWSPLHTFSHDAANLTLDAKAGGCWCETLPDGGSVRHATVVFAVPGRLLRLDGAMGPMQAMALAGVTTWTLKPSNGGTDITFDYGVGGYLPGGFAGLSSVVDRVFGEQVGRLKAYVETGRPEPKP